MGEFLTALPLLAQGMKMDALKGVRQGFIDQAFDSNLLSILGVAFGLCVLAFIADRLWRRRERRAEPKQLDYLSMAGRQVGLSLAEVELLRGVALRGRLAHPPAMLLSPGGMRYALLAAQRTAEDPKLAERMSALARRLFGSGLLDADHRRSAGR